MICPVFCHFFTVFLSFGYGTGSNTGIIIRIPTLIAIFIAKGHIYFQVRTRQVNTTETSATGIALVYLFVVSCRIFKEATCVFVETSGRKSEAVGCPVIVGEWHIIIIVGRCSHADISTLISERRFCVHFDKSSHRITSVESTLWSSENVNTFDISIVEVESGFVDIRDVVYVKSYGRSVDTWADSADINGSGQFGTIIGDKQIRDDACQVFHRVHLIGTHIILW